MTAAILDMQKLGVDIKTPMGTARILNDLDLKLAPGERMGIVGESGSGKSMMALAIMGLLPNAASTLGNLMFDGNDLFSCSEKQLCSIRGQRIAMIFQEPMSALNPVQTIGDQIAEGPRLHLGLGMSAAKARVNELMAQVGLSPNHVSPALYPHQLSGGQRQRVVIAIALASEPDLLIADEPTTALDVTIQVGILDLIARLAGERNMALIMISHDLGVIARTTSRMAVMYAGRIVEQGPTKRLLQHMAHPYTKGLFAALPQHAQKSDRPANERPRLPTIPGSVPGPLQPITGCAFAGRCHHTQADCRESGPDLERLTPGHQVACHHPLTTERALEFVH